jgi:hypothetical protein
MPLRGLGSEARPPQAFLSLGKKENFEEKKERVAPMGHVT